MNSFRIKVDNCSSWTLADGLREFISNLDDAAAITASTHTVEYVRKSWTATFVAIDAVPKGARCPVARLQWSKDTKQLLLINWGTRLSRDNVFDIGASSKQGQDTIGQFGEGVKSALGPLLRHGCTVSWHTEEFDLECKNVNSFVAFQEGSAMMPPQSGGYPEQSSTVYAHWTVIAIDGIAERGQLSLENFVFLNQKAKRVPVFSSTARKRTCILASPSEVGRVYIKDVFICKRAELPFGLNLCDAHPKLVRDRSHLNETAVQLFVHYCFNPQGHRWQQSFIQWVIKLLNQLRPSKFVSEVVKTLTYGNYSTLFRQVLGELSMHNTSVPSLSFVPVCRNMSEMSPDVVRLVCLLRKEQIHRVHLPLFLCLWPLYSRLLEEYRKQLLRQLFISISDSPLVLNPTQEARKTILNRYVRELLNDPSARVEFVDTAAVLPNLVSNKSLSVFYRYVCEWMDVNKVMMIDVNLLRPQVVHWRLTARGQYEVERAAPSKLYAGGKGAACSTKACYCLEAEMQLSINEYVPMSATYQAQFGLNWPHNRTVDNETVSRDDEVLLAMHDEGDLQPTPSFLEPDAAEDEKDDIVDVGSASSHVAVPALPPAAAVLPAERSAQVVVATPKLLDVTAIREMSEEQLMEILVEIRAELLRRGATIPPQPKKRRITAETMLDSPVV